MFQDTIYERISQPAQLTLYIKLIFGRVIGICKYAQRTSGGKLLAAKAVKSIQLILNFVLVSLYRGDQDKV